MPFRSFDKKCVDGKNFGWSDVYQVSLVGVARSSLVYVAISSLVYQQWSDVYQVNGS